MNRQDKKTHMTKENKSVTAPGIPIRFLFFLLLFSTPLLSLLWRRNYPIFTEEVLSLFLAIAVLSTLFSLVSFSIRLAVSYLLTAVLILMCFMLQFNLLMEGILVVIVLLTVLMLIFKERFYANGVFILLALLVGAYLDSDHQQHPDRIQENAAKVNRDLSPVVHILLDGFIGIGGLPDIPASSVIRKEILSFFESNDFLIFPNAYSRHAVTGDSLYTALNFRNDSEHSFGLETGAGIEHVMKENAVFSTVEALDYRLNIYQTSYIDLCQSNPKNVDRCWQYSQPNVHSVPSSEKTILKIKVLVKTLLNQSKFLWAALPESLRKSLGLFAVHDPRVFKLLSKDTSSRGPGNYFFAHALIPHSPFVYRPDCSVSYDAPIPLTVAFGIGEPVLPDYIYDTRNGLYFGQIECALKSTQLVIDGLKKRGLYDRAIIIIHGDHGSNISQYQPTAENQDVMTGQDYRSAFSTLFAVKYPGSIFSVNARALPLSYLLEEFVTALPSYVQVQKSYPLFEPSINSSADKTDLYVYPRVLPHVPLYINIFDN
ncbi:MAG: sulfatase-like hydrolase/transferase [Halioglobus sp.]